MRNILIIVVLLFAANNVNAGWLSSEGKLRIASDQKGAVIYIDGEKKGVVGDGYTVITVKEGNHEIRIIKYTKEWNYEGVENTFVADETSIELYIKTSRSPTQYRIDRLAEERKAREKRIAEERKLQKERAAKEKQEREKRIAEERKLQKERAAKEKQEKERRLIDVVNDFGSKINNNGKKLPPLSDTWSCALSKASNLMWEVKNDKGGLRDHKNTYTWFDPNGNVKGVKNGRWSQCNWANNCNTDAYVKEINSKRLCGYDDWRMPTIEELITLEEEITALHNKEKESYKSIFPYWNSKKCCYISSTNHRGNMERLHSKRSFSFSGDRATTSSNHPKFDQRVRVVRITKDRIINTKEFRQKLSGIWRSEEPVKKDNTPYKLSSHENNYLMYSVEFPDSDSLEGNVIVTLYSKADESKSISIDSSYKINAIGRFTLRENERKKLWSWSSGGSWSMLYDFSNNRIKAKFKRYNFTLTKE